MRHILLIATLGLFLASCGAEGSGPARAPLVADGSLAPIGGPAGIYPVALRPGETFTATYYITNPGSSRLRARLALSVTGPDGAIPDAIRDVSCAVPAQASLHPCVRAFVIPSNAAPGSYAIEFALWSGPPHLPESARLAAFTRQSGLLVLGENILMQSIARRYAPALQLARRDYAPMPVEILLDRADLRLSREGSAEAHLLAASQMADIGWNTPAAYLDVPRLEPKGNRILDHTDARNLYNDALRENKGRYPVTLYARAGSQNGRFFIQYWLFYFFNDYYNDHEGDWEWLQVNFATDDLAAIAAGTTPAELVYSRHGVGAPRPWGAVEKLGLSPVVYIGAGSHANYFDDEDERLDPKGARDEDETFQDRTFTPDEHVVALITEDTPWLRFQGMWGERSLPSGFSGPRGPMWQRLDNGGRDPWNDPFGWYPASS